MIFKRVGHDRPYPEHGLSSRGWSDVPPRQVRLDQLVTTIQQADVTGNRGGAALEHWLQLSEDRQEARRTRIAESEPFVPEFVWVILLLMVVVVVAFQCLFADPSATAFGQSVAMASMAATLFAALRVGSSEAMQSLFPVFFIFLFFSSASMPRDLIAEGWFRTVADLNPVSYLIESVRSLFVTGWDAEALALGFGFALLIAVVFLAAAASTLRTRLVRT